MGEEALGSGGALMLWRPLFGLSRGGSAPGDHRFRNVRFGLDSGRKLSEFERGFWFSKPSAPAAGRAGMPERSAGSSWQG